MSGTMLMVMGAGSAVRLANHTIQHTTLHPTACSVGYALDNDGRAFYTRTSLGLTYYANEWFVGAPITGIGSQYEARVTVNSGSLGSGPVGTWVSLSTGANWSRNQTSIGTSTCSITVEIRPAGGSGAIESCAINLEASVDN